MLPLPHKSAVVLVQTQPNLHSEFEFVCVVHAARAAESKAGYSHAGATAELEVCPSSHHSG